MGPFLGVFLDTSNYGGFLKNFLETTFYVSMKQPGVILYIPTYLETKWFFSPYGELSAFGIIDYNFVLKSHF